MLLDLFSTIVGGLLVITGVSVAWALTVKPKDEDRCPFLFDLNKCPKGCLAWEKCHE